VSGKLRVRYLFTQVWEGGIGQSDSCGLGARSEGFLWRVCVLGSCGVFGIWELCLVLYELGWCRSTQPCLYFWEMGVNDCKCYYFKAELGLEYTKFWFSILRKDRV
jgi:hypothetical protein